MENPQSSAPGQAVSEPGILLYGTLWCGATQRVRRFLDRLNLSYRFCNIDVDKESANQVRWWTGGYTSHPTLSINGEILIEPSPEELTEALTRQGLIQTKA